MSFYLLQSSRKLTSPTLPDFLSGYSVVHYLINYTIIGLVKFVCGLVVHESFHKDCLYNFWLQVWLTLDFMSHEIYNYFCNIITEDRINFCEPNF